MAIKIINVYYAILYTIINYLNVLNKDTLITTYHQLSKTTHK